jgi:CHAT domain-containing protein
MRKQQEAAKRDSAKLNQSELKLFDATRTYEQFITQLEQQYPSYYQLKLRSETTSSSAIRENLNEGEALVEFVVGDSTCFVFVITKQTFGAVAIPHNGRLNTGTLRFRNALRNLDFPAYTSSSYDLYTRLIAPVRKYLNGIRELTIIPDGPLHYLPFEALLTKRPTDTTPDFARMPYLITEFEIAYQPSATVLSAKAAEEKPVRPEKGFIGFAPVFNDQEKNKVLGADAFAVTTRSIRFDGQSYGALPQSEREVKTIAKLFEDNSSPARVYLHKSATESAIKEESAGSVVHVASHGFINEKNPKLSGLLFAKENDLEDGVLYTGEIYNMSLNAELVVLSACESGLGKVVRGEGILGLTRGFLYAGARNVVVSLWQVADKFTADLMIAFYRNLINGQPLASALRNAKLGIIKGGEHAYPLEWSPFVVIGG